MSGIATISAIKHPRYSWAIRYVDPLQREAGGRAKRVLRYFTSKEAAEAARIDLNKTLTVAGTAGVYLDAKIRADYLAARQVLDAAGLTAVSLFEAARSFAEGAKQTTATPRAIGPLRDEFLRYKAVDENKSQRWVSTLSIRVDRWIREQAIITTADITREAALATRSRAGVAVRTRLADMTAVSTFLEWLREDKWIAENPLRNERRPATDAVEIRTLDVDQVRRLLTAAQTVGEGRLLRYFAIAVFAGLRPSEIESLTPDRIKLDGREPIIRVIGGKRRQKVRAVPVLPVLREWLKSAPERWPIADIAHEDRDLFDQVREAAGLIRWTGDRRGKRETDFSLWQPDIMRHTFVSLRMAMTNDENLVAMEAGNSPDVIHAHYLSLMTKAEAKRLLAVRPPVRQGE